MLNNDNKLIKIKEASRILGVSMQTLKRWDQFGRLRAIRATPKGYRYYKLSDIQLIANDIFSLAKEWISSLKANEPADQFFCVDNYIFQSRLNHLEIMMRKDPELEQDFSLISSVVGEIGNNSFDHNLGSWPDIQGIFFAYDLNKRQIVLADRGQGIFTTLQRVCPNLKNDSEALHIAFTEKISGRAPKNRGNGLKYVKKVLTDTNKNIPLKLYFQSGNASVSLNEQTKTLTIEQANIEFRGCLALINF